MAFKSSIVSCILLSSITHAILLVYGEFHDAVSVVKFTDIDYQVFTDAAKFVVQGSSPFDRATYRYSPLFAWILVPGTLIHKCFGKVLFSITDVVAGYLIFAILRQQNVTITKSLYCASAWLFNPMVLVVSARGNAESVLAAAVLSSLLLVLNKRSRLAGCVFGLSVHIKIYPIIYAMPFYFALEFACYKSPVYKNFLYKIFYLFWPTHKRINFVLFSLIGFVVPTAISYLFYGEKYIQEAFLYHTKRHDIKHNFSPYFYLLYLTVDRPERWISTITFVPQLAIVIIFAFKLYRPSDLSFCLFLQTYAFVAFNKVCTSQYFLWYLCLLPLTIPKLRFQWKKLVHVIFLWVTSQAVWLFAAYTLEFGGRDTFLYIWIAGLIFFISNIYVMDFFIKSYCQIAYQSITSKVVE